MFTIWRSICYLGAMDRIFTYIKTLEKWLLQSLVFFIPTNLALHLYKSQAHVYGITIDYLIPKIYVSDFIVMALLGLWLLRNVKTLPSVLNTALKHGSLIALLIATLVVSAYQSQYPVAGYWFLLKLAEMSVLVLYMIHNLKLESIKWPLSLTLLFQALVGIIQWVQKQSLLGYYFLGETTIRNNSYIAKTGVTGEIRPLPYGTTPHPNVVAGFLAVGLLIILLIDQIQKPSKKSESSPTWLKRGLGGVTRLVFALPILLTLLLTQSVSAVIVLIVGLILLKFKALHWRNGLAIVAIFLATGLAVSPYVESTSVTRRVQLTEISLKMILAEPWLGVGPNNFTARMTDFGRVISTTRFLQPVHNIYLLWVSETGLVSTGLLLLILFKFSKTLGFPSATKSESTKTNKKSQSKKVSHKALHTKLTSQKTAMLHYSVPIIAIAIIGLADHYPLSLQTGQLLSVLCLSLPLSLWYRQKTTKLKQTP